MMLETVLAEIAKQRSQVFHPAYRDASIHPE
jgi:hypothetical protein